MGCLVGPLLARMAALGRGLCAKVVGLIDQAAAAVARGDAALDLDVVRQQPQLPRVILCALVRLQLRPRRGQPISRQGETRAVAAANACVGKPIKGELMRELISLFFKPRRNNNAAGGGGGG